VSASPSAPLSGPISYADSRTTITLAATSRIHVTSTPTGHPGNQISTWSAGGIGAGAGTLLGIILGLLLASCFQRRNRLCRNLAIGRTPKPTTYGSEPGLLLTQSFNSYLIDCSSDREIKEELGSVCYLIEQHTWRKYHLSPVPQVDGSSLAHLGLSEETRNRIRELAVSPTTRHIAIRHLLVIVIFRNIDIYTIGPLSLLPPVVNSFILSLPKSNILDGHTTTGNNCVPNNPPLPPSPLR